MAVPYSFATQTGSIPLSQLDSNFSTAITLGNTAVVLGNTYSTIGNLTLSNVTISSGNVSINVSNVSTINTVTLTVTGNETVGGNVTITGNVSVNVANVTTLNATSSTITGNESVLGNVTVTGNVSVNNATFSNSFTLSGGTANGVAYLNGSKVVTSGSGLTFDGTNFSVTNGFGTFQANQAGVYVKSTGAFNPFLNFYSSTTTLEASVYAVAGSSALAFALTPAATEQMRLTSTGLGIGTSSPSTPLHVVGTTRIARSGVPTQYADISCAAITGFTINVSAPSGLLTMSTDGGTTKMVTVDGSGNLLVGKTSAGLATAGGQINASGAGFFTTASGSDSVVAYQKTSTATNTLFSGYSDVGSTQTNVFLVSANGNVKNTNNSYGAISDISLKENIVDATPKLDDLMKVQIRQYNLKSDPTHKQIGVIAQELETVFPSMVEEADGIKGVKYSVFVPMLIKAIQEQQAIIEQLKAKVGI